MLYLIYFDKYLLSSQFYKQIDLKHINQTKQSGENNKVELGIDLREFYPSVEWDILGVPAERHVKYYTCCLEPYPGTVKSCGEYIFFLTLLTSHNS